MQEIKNFEIIAENIAGAFYFSVIIAKYITCFLAESKLQFLYEQITKDWKEIKDKDERAILKRYANTGRFLAISYMAYWYVAAGFFVTIQAIIPTILDLVLPKNESRPLALCYYAEYFVDEQEYFFYLLFHTWVAVFSTILVAAGIDCTYVSIVQHVLGLFKIVDCRLKKANKIIDECASLENKKRSLSQSHKFVKLIQTTYSDCFLASTIMTVLALAIGTIDILFSFNNIPNLIRLLCLWFGIIVYQFYINWPGQKVLDINEKLLRAMYSCKWYKFSLKTQYLIKFMMMRCTIPCLLTAGPLIPMNFESCSLVLRTAMSYFTVVASLN